MNSKISLIVRLVAYSVRISEKAGSIIRDIQKKGNLGIKEKAEYDYQTAADRSAQVCIVASLAKHFPNINIVAEEDNVSYEKSSFPEDWIVEDYDKSLTENITCPVELENIDENRVTVWVDPLDGTFEFTKGGLSDVTVLIGIAVDDKAIAGVIHQPFFDEYNGKDTSRTVWGIIGVGTGNYKLVKPPTDQRTLVISKSHGTPEVERTIACMNADEIIRVGGTGNKTLYLTDGKAHVYLHTSRGTKKWDTCAPEAILRAAGGIFTDSFGTSYLYNKNVQHENLLGIAASSPGENHEFYLSRIPENVKDILKSNLKR